MRGSITSSIFVSILIAFTAMVLFAVPSDAAINSQINFQGKITNPNGTNVTNGSFSFVFSIYTVASGGVVVWTESKSITVTDGIFQTALGDTTALPGSVDFNNASLFLGIRVGADAEMTPRVRLTSAPYAFNSGLLNGLASTNFVQLAQGVQVDASATNSSIAVNKTGGTASILQLQRAGTDVLNINNSGSYAYDLSAANNPTYIITNSGTNNVVTNLASTGDFIIQDSGVAFASFLDNGGILFAPAAAGDLVINQVAGSNVQITATAAPIVDQVAISNVGQPTVTSGANGLSIDFVGGAAAVEASGARVDLTPGTTAGGVWNGLRIVANATGAVSGVNEYGISLDGPITPGAGVEVGIVIDAKWDAGMQLESKSAEPPTPPAGNIYVYSGLYAGRSILSQKGSSGVAFAYQPAIFQNAITFNGPSTGAATTSFGTSYSVDTTASHPAATEVFGYTTNFATAAVAADTAGISQTNTQLYRGSVSGGANGFFFVSRAGFPDANYGVGATGSRTWVGLTDQVAATANALDNAAGNYAGFMYSTNRGDTNWQFTTKNNATQNLINTGMAFAVNRVYDFYVYTPPLGTIVYWRIDNLTDGTTFEGNTAVNLPTATVSMRSVLNIRTLTTTARNMRVAKIYTEADR